MVSTRDRKGSTKSAKNVNATGENEERKNKGKKRQSDRIEQNQDTACIEDRKRGKNSSLSESNLNTSSLIMGTESASTSSSDSDDSEKLVIDEYKNVNPKSLSQWKNESSNDSDTSSHTSVSSDDKQSSRPHQTGHQISDSEVSTDSEIQEIAKSHSNDIIDDMSDFSIQSPKKRKGTPAEKNTFSENLTSGSPKKGMKREKAKSDSSDLFDSDSEISKTSGKTVKSSDRGNVSLSSPKKGKGKKSGMSSTTRNGNMVKEVEIESIGKSTSSPQKRKDKKSSPSKSVGKEPTEQNLSLRYKIPEGFEPTKLTVSNRDLCKEDLDGKELWLIKAPVDFDIQQLSDVEIDLNGTADFQTNKDYYEVIGTADRTHEMALFNSVLPSKEKASFTVGPRFKGQIHVMQSIDIPSLPPIQRPEPVIHEIPAGLKPRFEPFGSDSPMIMKKKNRHHHHRHHNQDQTDLSGSPNIHKRKHKLEQDETDNGQSEVKKMKKEKKKKIKKEHD